MNEDDDEFMRQVSAVAEFKAGENGGEGHLWVMNVQIPVQLALMWLNIEMFREKRGRADGVVCALAAIACFAGYLSTSKFFLAVLAGVLGYQGFRTWKTSQGRLRRLKRTKDFIPREMRD